MSLVSSETVGGAEAAGSVVSSEAVGGVAMSLVSVGGVLTSLVSPELVETSLVLTVLLTCVTRPTRYCSHVDQDVGCTTSTFFSVAMGTGGVWRVKQ